MTRIRDIDDAIACITNLDRMRETFKRLCVPAKEEMCFAENKEMKVNVKMVVGKATFYFFNGKYVGIGGNDE
jgi:hypothetical protein